LDWVESVEVSRGGKTDNGGEAIGGVLSITTRRAASASEFSAGAEAFPTYSRLNFFRSAKTGSLSGLLSYSRTQGPGDFKYTITEDDGVGPFTVNLGKTYRRINADIARDQLLLKASSALPDGGMIEASGTMDRAARGMPGFLAPQLTPDARQTTAQDALNLRAIHSAGAANIEVRASYQHDVRDYNDPDVYSFVHHSAESSGEWEGEIRGKTTLRNVTVSAGALLARESFASEQIANGEAKRWRGAGFAQAKQPLWSNRQEYSITGDAGLRWEKYGNGQALLPKLGLTCQHSASLPVEVNVSWGKSYRAPSFYSLFWLDDQTVQGNPNLQAEVSSEWTGNASIDPPVLTGMRFEASMSDQHINNLIYWKRTFDNRWKPFNLQRARVQTLDLSLQQDMMKDRVRLTVGVNWTEARDATDDRNTGGKYLTFRAPRSYRGSLNIKDYGFDLTASYRWISARPVLETNSKWLEEYQVVDGRLSYAFRLSRVNIEPSVGAENLLNTNYRIVRFAPMPGRELYAAIRFSQN
jgi:outer membrane cobalamin receptor